MDDDWGYPNFRKPPHDVLCIYDRWAKLAPAAVVGAALGEISQLRDVAEHLGQRNLGRWNRRKMTESPGILICTYHPSSFYVLLGRSGS